MRAAWAKLETHTVNGAFPLQRCVGSTEHSGVFLTQSTPHAPSAAALKVVPFDPRTAEAQLSRWRAAIELSHPHLLRIFEAGECRLDGQPWLYARMEFAEQTLAEVLEQRALTEDEVGEMVDQTLGALEYLHQNGFAHGALKPSNLLVVGDRLKLASDTVGPIGNPDEASDDIRALGLTICEALTRVRPAAGDFVPPPGLPVRFAGFVARCLSRDPRDRPEVAELHSLLPVDTVVAEEPAQAAATRLVIRVELPGEERPRVTPPPPRRSVGVLPWAVGAVVVLALGFMAYRLSSSSRPVDDSPPPAEVATAVSPVPPAPTPVAPPRAAPAVSPETATNEVMPNVSRSALDTVRGTLRVTVRVGVDSSGSVVSATAVDPGPSRYFERRSLEAARQWTFAPTDAPAQRSMRLRFAFTRGGVEASAEPLP